ncbi:Protein MAIN-LIKE 1 [Glycine max]|nr:Protein MAIN-LIKE 1 [Glycine max]
MSDGFCGTHLQIMVMTRGLGRALGQGRRPTASARRQRVTVTVDHVDEPVIPDPDVQDDPMEAPAAVEDILAQAAEDQHQGFPGGLSDPSVLTAYADHIACSVWTGEECPELKLSSHGRKVHSLGRPVPAIEGLIAGTGLSPLIACLADTGDRFHLPVGELTITLDDISSLLHLPVIGDLHAFQPLHVDDAVQMLVELLMAGHWTAATRAYLLHLLGCTLFANKSATNVYVVYLEALCDLSMTERYAWGVAALVHMYDQLNDASMSHSRQLGGYISLLQCWIYEHFPSVTESTADQDYDKASPRACRERLDRLRISDVCWIPYGEHREVRDFHVRSCYSSLLRWGPVAVYYRPERVVQQFGYTQTIPAPPVDSWVSYDDIHDRWMHYEDHIVPAGEVCVVPRVCSSDYIDWFFRISHPFMTPGHPRVVPEAPQTDIPHVSEPGASSTSAEEPRHAVEVCDDIVERLERHLSLGVVTPGSSTHEVIEECLRLARSVTHDHLVYVRCRRRRRTNQAWFMYIFYIDIPCIYIYCT